MKKPLITLFILSTILLLTGCDIRTPQINGIVLDEETKQPVPDAWVRAMIELNTTTIAGDVHSPIAIDQPHTRTDKDGKFVIPSRKIKGSAFPFEFGSEVISLAIGASTAEDMESRVNYYGSKKKKIYGEGDGKLDEIISKDTVEIKMYAKNHHRTESKLFRNLQSLHRYCIIGRSSVEIPGVKGGCDEWELDYAIKKHEMYFEKFREPENDQISHYSIAMEQLASLYKLNTNYFKSLQIFYKVKEFHEKNGMKRSLNEYERKIDELEKILK